MPGERAWMAVMAPAGTPTEVVERMNREINDALLLPDVREKLAGDPKGLVREAAAKLARSRTARSNVKT